jgi:hypothetical protein
MKNTRRDFVKQTGLTASGLILAPWAANAFAGQSLVNDTIKQIHLNTHYVKKVILDLSLGTNLKPLTN